jgi:hypothetical protein
MEKGNSQHGKEIEPRLRELHDKFKKLEVNSELFTIIHSPGWTTPIDVHFVKGTVEAMHRHVDALQHQLGVLDKGCRMISKEAK